MTERTLREALEEDKKSRQFGQLQVYMQLHQVDEETARKIIGEMDLDVSRNEQIGPKNPIKRGTLQRGDYPKEKGDRKPGAE